MDRDVSLLDKVSGLHVNCKLLMTLPNGHLKALVSEFRNLYAENCPFNVHVHNWTDSKNAQRKNVQFQSVSVEKGEGLLWCLLLWDGICFSC